MLNDVAWRKMPTDILTNETMTYIESQMPAGYEYAPFMFYQAALKKCDDDGIFDLSDGIIFSRLMRVPDVSLVFLIANLMGKQRMIYRISANSNICFFADWEYNKGTPTRSLAERRAIVQRQIDEQAQIPQAPQFEEAPEIPFESFSMSMDDKNAKNVVKNGFDDKNAKNVVKKNETERERERENREREKKDTHTERDRESVREEEREAGAVGGYLENPPTAPAEKKKPLARETKEAETTKSDKTETTLESSPTSLAEEALQSQNVEQKTEGVELAAVVNVLEGYFSEKIGYNPKKGRKTLEKIASCILEFKNTDVPPVTIAHVMLEEFQKMHDSGGIWHDIPLQPVYMAKEGVWAHLLEYVGQNLAKGKKKNIFLAKAKEYQKTFDDNKSSVQNELAKEYAKYGIDPKDPLAFKKISDARKAEEQEPVYEGDIF